MDKLRFMHEDRISFLYGKMVLERVQFLRLCIRQKARADWNIRAFPKGEVLLEMPDNTDKNILNSRAALIEEGKDVACILKGGNVIAVVGYKE